MKLKSSCTLSNKNRTIFWEYYAASGSSFLRWLSQKSPWGIQIWFCKICIYRYMPELKWHIVSSTTLQTNQNSCVQKIQSHSRNLKFLETLNGGFLFLQKNANFGKLKLCNTVANLNYFYWFNNMKCTTYKLVSI